MISASAAFASDLNQMQIRGLRVMETACDPCLVYPRDACIFGNHVTQTGPRFAWDDLSTEAQLGRHRM